MFSRRRTRQPVRGDASGSDSITSATPRTLQRQSQELQEWRSSARRVARAWNSWLAADRHDRDARYHTFVSALDDEEQAAAEARAALQSTDMASSPLQPTAGLTEPTRRPAARP
jgi:hypothetical protein